MIAPSPHHFPGLAALLLATLLAGCGEEGDDVAHPPENTTYFGPLSDTPVTFRLTGTIRYEDRLYGATSFGGYGFTGITLFKPVRHAVIDLVDESGRLLLTTRTDSAGAYDLTIKAAGLLRLRILARTDPASGMRITVKTADGDLYAATRHFVPAAGELDLDADIPAASVGGAWNILDVCTAGAEFIRLHTGVWPPTPLTAFWSPGSAEGTWFQDGEIHVLGGSEPGIGDTDEYDDDVLLHEFGHFVESFSGNLDSSGGFHVLTDNTQDLRLSWSEGFASYFSGATKRWLDETRSGVLSDTSGTMSEPQLGPLYLDTFGNGERLHWFFDIDYSTQSSLDLAGSFSTAETSIAKVLWNMTKEFGAARLWENYRAMPDRTRRHRPVSIETFWDEWTTAWPGEPPRDAYRERRIDYSADTFETDDRSRLATALEIGAEPFPGEAHTLHQQDESDVDYFKLRLSAHARYAIETFGLLNGADTLITIHSPADIRDPLARCGSKAIAVCENDNGSGENHAAPEPDTDADHRLMLNDGCKLASRLSFTPAATGTYLVRVTRSRTPSPGAGRYGAYYLKVSTSPSQYRCPQ